MYLVGGSVRNLLLEKPAKDWDLTTNAKPEEILPLFPDAFYDNSFGTVGIPIKIISSESPLLEGEDKDEVSFQDKPKSQVIEVTTFRTEQG